jgi:hypothetical protein
MKFRSPVYASCAILFPIIIAPLFTQGQNGSYDSDVRIYVDRYKNIAVQEMMIYRIPASITLAQGILESNAGKSRLATEANNHFGIKCHADWQGKTFTQDDETKNECFRKYENPFESFRDHSYFLSQRDRYKSLFNLDINDYKKWAYGLKQAGYATNPKYPEQLIRTIENYELYRFDVADFSLAFADSVAGGKPAVGEVAMEGPGHRNILTNNGLKYIIAQKDDNVKDLAEEFAKSPKQIWKFNDMKKGAAVVAGQMVYLETKRRKGAATFHVVRPGETMYTISQLNGIRLDMLYKKNKISRGHPLKPGQKLLLR